MGKTNSLNDGDLEEFVQLQETYADSEKSWAVDVGGIDASTYDLSVKNPNTPEEAPLREPEVIMAEIAELDAESGEILQEIKRML
jgi:type I restriction enzyme M protein